MTNHEWMMLEAGVLIGFMYIFSLIWFLDRDRQFWPFHPRIIVFLSFVGAAFLVGVVASS